ncbi:hypothetical protein, partial [Methylobacterium gnaphalii]
AVCRLAIMEAADSNFLHEPGESVSRVLWRDSDPGKNNGDKDRGLSWLVSDACRTLHDVGPTNCPDAEIL